MFTRRTPLRAAHAVVAATAVVAAAIAMAAPAQAAIFTGPAVQMIPQQVPQLPPGQGQLILTADGTSVGDIVRQQVDIGLRKQKWHFNGGTAAQQIVNDLSGLCLQGGASAGNTVRLATCVDPNRIDLSVTEQRQFWQNRPRRFNGVVVHRLDNVQNGFSMGVRDGSTSPGGILDQEVLTGQPNQLFRLA